MTVQIVGIDCATTDAEVGVAQGLWSDGKVAVQEVALCGPERTAVSIVTRWLRDSNTPGLLAIDAPLGWPKPLPITRPGHRAGERILARTIETRS